jgi:hypothetical protein
VNASQYRTYRRESDGATVIYTLTGGRYVNEIHNDGGRCYNHDHGADQAATWNHVRRFLAADPEGTRP